MKIKVAVTLLTILAVTFGFNACGPDIPSQSASSTAEPGEWRTFSNGNEALDLLVDGNEVWAATTGGVVCWNTVEGTYQRYTTLDRLASNTVNKVVRDSTGNIWALSAVNGVSRFNGSKWETFTVENGLVSNDVITIAADKKGGIWVSAFWGVSYFDGGQWSSYSNKDPGGIVVGGENPMKGCKNLTSVDADLSSVDVIFVDSRDDVWFSNRHDGITRYSNGNWEIFTEDDGMGLGGARAYLEDEAGNIWAGSLSDVSRFDGEKWETYHISDAIPRSYVQNIAQDNNGDTWVTAYENVVARYDGTDWYYYTMEDGLPANNVSLLFKDKNGILCAVTESGMSRYVNGRWQPFSGDTFMKGVPRSVTLDKEGNLWFCSVEDGIVRYNGEEGRSFITGDGLSDNSVTALAEDSRNAIWFGTQDGSVNCYDNQRWETFEANEVGAGEYIFSLLADSRGNIWTAGRDGVSRYDGVAWQMITGAVGIVEDMVNPIFEDSSGNIWLNTVDGVSGYDGNDWNIPNELKHFSATDIAEDSRGNLWFAGNKIYRFDGTDWREFPTAETIYSILPGKDSDVWFVTKDRGVSYYSDGADLIEPLPDKLPFQPWLGGTLLDSKSNLWLAAFYTQSGGLNRYDGKGWKTYTPGDSLADYQVSALLEDKEGNIWAITKKGVSYFDGDKWHILTAKDGLASNYVNCLMEDSEGNIWFGTDGGVSCYSKKD